MTILTLGHGTLDASALTELVVGAGVEIVVDVRRYPDSRRHPHVRAEEMAGWLGEVGVGHHWIEALGGRRRSVADSPNVGLTNEQFRNYADHMATDAFRSGVVELLDLASDRPTAVMCSESVWWRCHRRLLADHLVLVEGVPVEHLFHDGRVSLHPPLPEARVVGERLVYDRSR